MREHTIPVLAKVVSSRDDRNGLKCDEEKPMMKQGATLVLLKYD